MSDSAASCRPCDTKPFSAAGPAAAAGLYLWNPLAIAACCGGSSASLEGAAVLCALWLAACRRGALAAIALACAAHLSLHAALLLVRSVLVVQSMFTPCTPCFI